MRRQGAVRRLVAGAPVLGFLALAACGAPPPAADGGLPVERRAALAHLVVENRTGHEVTIVLRYAVEPGGEITLGSIAAGERRELPPIPATEPVLLTARAPGFERRLEPRSFDIDERWTWVIEAADER